MIRAVLFDVGGPLDMETASEAAIDADIRGALAREGFGVDEAAWQEANRYAVEAFAPSVYQAIVWRLTGRDVAACQRIFQWMEAQAHNRDLFQLRPGIADVLAALKLRGLNLGIVANQPLAVLKRLDREGIGHYFESRVITGTHGFRKPDVRLFLQACEDLDVSPGDCVMVGDRIDNDVLPAKVLGMRTVLLRTGRHIEQQPRIWEEVPDMEVRDAPEILKAIDALVAASKTQEEGGA